MIFYHGTKSQGLNELLPLNQLNHLKYKVGSTDVDRDNFRDKVFITTSRDLAKQYAGKKGVVYIVNPCGVQLYHKVFLDRVNNGMIKRKSKKVLAKKVAKLQQNNTVFVCNSAKVKK